MSWARRIRWVLLAAVPSSLMLGVTSYVSTDLSPFPLVWIVPLSLYLLSFILVFSKFWTGAKLSTMQLAGTAIWRGPGATGFTLHEATIFVLQPLGLLALTFIVLRGGFDPFMSTTFVMLGFFGTALACHGELAADRPNTRHLTEYFLLMSVGGVSAEPSTLSSHQSSSSRACGNSTSPLSSLAWSGPNMCRAAGSTS